MLLRLWIALQISLVLLVAAADARSAPVAVSPSDPHIRYVGRFDRRDPRGPRCAWAGSSVRLAFEGTAVSVRMRDTGAEDYFAVIVDGTAPRVLTVRPSQELYEVARGLPRGRHVVELVKRTEPLCGTAQFLGFVLDPAARVLQAPPPQSRRLEIIGDSISAGFGNEAAGKEEAFTPRTENNLLAYGTMAGRALGADVACIAWSGRKLFPDNTMPEVYDRALPHDPASRWDFKKWTPHAVVINLATNDFRDGIPEQAAWTGAYRAFIKRIRKQYPAAHIFCTVGSMLSDGWPVGAGHLSAARRYVKQVASDASDPRIHFLEFPEQQAADGYGASWHPSRRTHEKMASILQAALSDKLGWDSKKDSR